MKRETKNSKKRALAVSACALAAAGVTGAAFLLFGTGEPRSVTVSAGLQQLADRAYLAASAPVGESVAFDAAWFDAALQGAAVSAVTVTQLPDVTAGELMLGHGEVSVGQRIDRDNLSYLSFVPQAGAGEASFTFVPETAAGAAGYALTCRLSLTEGVNCCPAASGSVTAVSTYSTLAISGTLEAEDPDGDALYFEAVSYPANGTLSLDAETGRYTYLPRGQFAGEDTFTWRAQDAHGAFSPVSTVTVTVRALATGYLFSDLEGDAALHTAALRVSEKGLMSGEALGGKHYFRPDRTLSRAAFVSVLLKAAGIDCPEADDTGYTDDADIPRGMKGAIKYAREQGWLGEDTVFRPGDAVTRAEAASIAAKVLGLAAPGYGHAAEDHANIPVSVVDALYAVYEGGYLGTMSDGSLAPAAALTRGEAASFFARVIDETKSAARS